MASLLAFDAIILLLTLYKVYRSGSYRFFNSNTVLGTILGKKNRNLHDEDPMKLAATKVAADLIGQGLYDFIILFLVGVAALVIWCTTSLPRIYRSLGVIGLAAVSAALAGGVFRETARAATALHAFRDFELKLQAMQQLAETQHKELEALFYARRYRDDDEDYDAQSKFTGDHSNAYHREATTPVPLSAHESDRITVSRQPSYTGEFRTPTEKGWTGPHTDDGYTSEPLSRNMVHEAQPLSPTAPRPQEEVSPIEELEYSRRDSTDLHSAAHLNARTADQDDSDSEATFGKGLETRSDSDFRRYMRQNAPPSTHQTRSLRRAKRGRTVYGADERFPDFATSLARSTAIAAATNSRTQQLGFSAAADGSRSGSASGSAYNAGASASSSRNNLPLGMSLAAFDAPSEEGSEGTHTSFPLPPERRDTLAGVTILGGGVETNWSRPTTLYSAQNSLPTAHGGAAGLPHPPPTYSSRTALNMPGNEAYEMGSRDAAGLSSSLPPPRRPSRKPVGNREYGA
ncbi:hypothetical protein CBOM_03711 [Ceraceosorus bombacis]|uniref:Uncharacterized protein n=1 Tax=Ceraceosorus bombacis TaxID=401625 RepID=A0A0P1BH78_9BASI|nr:hypothetical protein CBOM_03711 [Ceraceosorus bombacis]